MTTLLMMEQIIIIINDNISEEALEHLFAMSWMNLDFFCVSKVVSGNHKVTAALSLNMVMFYVLVLKLFQGYSRRVNSLEKAGKVNNVGQHS